jgi:hypothetical protein
MQVLKIYLSGIVVLVGAILINGLAGLLGLPTWYTFLKSAGELGLWDALRRLALVEVLFLFVLYPAGLGLLVFAAVRIFKFFS